MIYFLLFIKLQHGGGCWFCHNQNINQLRALYNDYPEYWDILLKWEKDSPVFFRSDKHTLAEFTKRFRLENEGKIDLDKHFFWNTLDKYD